jgi:hypothetical protein
MTAPELLRRAADIIEQRGTEYDTTGIKQERSMPRIVELFGESTGRQMTIGEGYLLMMAVKTARLERSPGHLDSRIDRLAYQALKDEHELGGGA